MSRRLDIELTSKRDDATWTWRAAGAREPKGVVASELLPDAAATGLVLRAEVEQTLDGLEVLSTAVVQDKRTGPERIEVIGRPGRADEELVTSTLAPRGEGRGRGRERGRRDRGPEGRGRERHDRDRPRREDGPGGGRPQRERRERPARSFAPPPPLPERPKPKRLRPLRTHRAAAVAALPEEQRPIAEQVLRGGVPAVRKALDEQNERAKAEGLPVVEAKGVVALAEKLLPVLRAAEWRDRADAALADLDELDLRDLRSVVAAAEQGARDDEARQQATQLREGLTRRVEEEQALWLDEVTQLVDGGRVARALRVAARPPKAGTQLPDELAGRLVAAANASMTAETGQERYATMIDAVATSPVRARVVPAGIPAEPTAELQKAVRRFAAKAPGVAAAFGVAPPPPKSASGAPRPIPAPPTARPIPPPPTLATEQPAPAPAPVPAPAPASTPAAAAPPAASAAVVEQPEDVAGPVEHGPT